MQNQRPSIVKIYNNLYRITQAHANEALAKYQLSSGTYPYLLALYKKEGINQNRISRELNIDKAMSARAIKKLIELDYIKKESDYEDSRAYKLFLTDKAKAVIPLVKEELDKWNKIITKDLNHQEEEKLVQLLERLLNNAKEYRKDLCKVGG